MHKRAIFSNARKKRARKKLINIYEAVLFFNFEWCVRFITKEGFHVGDITWFCTEVFGVSLFLKWPACIVKKKEKVFDQLGTSLQSEQDQKI